MKKSTRCRTNIVKSMIDLHEFLWGFSIVSLVFYFFRGLRKAITMSCLGLNSPLSSPPTHPLSWVGQLFLEQGSNLVSLDSESRQENKNKLCEVEEATQCLNKNSQENSNVLEEKVVRESIDVYYHQKGFPDRNYQENSCGLEGKVLFGKNIEAYDKISQENSGDLEGKVVEENRKVNDQKGLHGHVLMGESPDALGISKVCRSEKGAIRMRKRPARLLLPECCAKVHLQCEMETRKLERKEFEVEGRDFILASKKGRREVMEDGYGVMVDILGDPKQAFFAVIDGHGGRAAADYVSENLGRNIVKELGKVGEEHVKLEDAIRVGYEVTDKEFLSQGVGSGACTASVLLKNGELHVANAGDCRVVLSRKGIANSMTMDHRLTRDDERLRIENAGGFVHCRNGVWRVHGSLAVSRAIGDLHLKDWIISEPEIKSLPLTSDCEFLIMASDGLWDKVDEQEAVDVVSRDYNSLESCKKLIDMSSSRGNMDDITIMVINLQKFVTNCT